MTIKQQGGIFGRNPTFNDVEVEGTLTGSVSGNVTVSSGSSSFQKIGIQNTSPTAPLTIGYSGAEAQIQINNSGGSRMFYAGAFNEDEGIVRLFNSSNVETVRIPAESTAGIHTYFNTGNVGVGTTTPSAKLSVSGGNISVDSGYGIDFSATSGTGTSELFDDYEEGTWTPALTGTGGASGQAYSSQTGDYTKIGDTVFVTGYVALSTEGTVSGWARLTGLPYTPSKNGAGVASYIANMSVTDGLFLQVRTDGNVYLNTQDVSAIAAATLFTNTSTMKFSLTYKV